MKVGPFPVNKGVRQGCPLSMLLFNVAINQVLFAVDPDQIAFKILAYADDIAITSTSLEELQVDVNKANALIQWCGMKIKPTKCGLLSHQPPLRFGCALNQYKAPDLKSFTIDGCPIPIVDEDGSQKYKYLGVLRGKNIRQTPITVYQMCLEKLRQITQSSLLPWQALDAIKIFIH